MKPSYQDRKPLTLREIPPGEKLSAAMVNPWNSYLRCYTLGECTVVVTKEYGRWHLSISHRLRNPTWDEIAEARYRLLPDSVTAAMILPPKSQYINLNKNCFQVVELPAAVAAELAS